MCRVNIYSIILYYIYINIICTVVKTFNVIINNFVVKCCTCVLSDIMSTTCIIIHTHTLSLSLPILQLGSPQRSLPLYLSKGSGGKEREKEL